MKITIDLKFGKGDMVFWVCEDDNAILYDRAEEVVIRDGQVAIILPGIDEPIPIDECFESAKRACAELLKNIEADIERREH